jgi:UDP-glucose 4-epimerase
METVLITGSNGLIGEELSVMLKKNTAYQLYGVGRSKVGKSNTIILDLSTDWSDEVLPKKIDVVVHLAQSEKFRDFPNSALEVFNVNTLSTLKLLDYAKKAGARKFIYASSGGVYGNSDTGFMEDSPLQPNKDLGFYLSTKFSSELLLANYANYFSINILRFFFVYGPKQRKNMLIPRLIESVKTGVPINLQGEEGIRINPVYVTDAVKTIVSVLKDPASHNINIGGEEIISIKGICKIIGCLVDREPYFEYQKTEVKNLIGDITKMKSFHAPKITFENGVRNMLSVIA